MTGSNRRPPACKAGALPAELIPQSLALVRAFRFASENQAVRGVVWRRVRFFVHKPIYDNAMRRLSRSKWWVR
jgi:hypothetical protein